MLTLTSGQAQNRFGELLDTAQREPVLITRRGRTVAYLLSPTEYQALAQHAQTALASQQRKKLLAGIRAFAGSGKGGGTQRLLAERKAERARKA